MRLVLFLPLLSLGMGEPPEGDVRKTRYVLLLPAFYLSLDKIGSGSA